MEKTHVWNLVPDFHVLYYLRDHIPYPDDNGRYIRDETGRPIPCDLVSTPCLVGRKQEPCKGKRVYCTRQARGPAMYFTTRPLVEFTKSPELMPGCAAIRMGQYPRRNGELCEQYCEFRAACQEEIEIRQAAA